MKRRSILTALFVVLFAITSCETPVEPAPDQGKQPISLNATMSAFTRATDTAFEEGDAIGLYILTPAVYLDNGKFTLANGEWGNTDSYKWYDDAELLSTVIGYYPYQSSQNFSDGNISFTVNADQSTHALYTASDLMLATATTAPTEAKVALPFSHVLSKVVVSIDNKTTEQITDVYLADIYGSASVSLADKTAAYNGSKGTVKASSATDVTGATVWPLIIVPQTATPQLIITTASQKQYTYELDEEVVFSAGKQCNASITLNAESKPTGFTTDITDWTSDKDLNFHQKETAEWVSIGKGKYVEDAMVNVFKNMYPYEVEVEIEESASVKGRYRLVNPYADAFGAQEGYIIVNASAADKIYMEESYTGYSHSVYGQFYIGSLSAEYGYDNVPYGYFREDGVIVFPQNGLYVKYGDRARLANVNGMTTITLPGYTRTPTYYGFGDFTFDGMTQIDTGGYAAKFTVVSMIDNQTVKVGVLDGVLYSNEIEAKVKEMVDGTLPSEETKIKGGGSFELQIPITTAGTHTAIVYTVDSQGNPYWFFRQFACVIDGGDVPACDLAIGTISQSATHPESRVCFNVRCSDVLNTYIAAVKSSELTVASDQYADYAVKSGVLYTATAFRKALMSDAGFEMVVADLEPETEYTVIVYAESLYGVSAVRSGTVTTGSTPQWVRLDGKGRFYDHSRLFDNNYGSDVEIQQVAGGAKRYRVMRPYHEYWSTADSADYSGSSAEYIEFYVAKENGNDVRLAFERFNTGYKTEEGTPIVAELTVPDIALLTMYMTSMYNVQKQEGVFQLAPWYMLLDGTNRGINYSTTKEAIIITLPGYSFEFTPASSSAPALMPVQNGKGITAEKAVVNLHRSIKIGKPISRKIDSELTLNEGCVAVVR